MDLLKAWVLAAIVYIAINFALAIVAPPIGGIYLLCPLLAAAAASTYHAARGVGGWVRHVLAVVTIPVVLGWYWLLVLSPTGTAPLWQRSLGSTALALLAAGIGLGIVMAARALLSGRAAASTR